MRRFIVALCLIFASAGAFLSTKAVAETPVEFVIRALGAYDVLMKRTGGQPTLTDIQDLSQIYFDLDIIALRAAGIKTATRARGNIEYYRTLIKEELIPQCFLKTQKSLLALGYSPHNRAVNPTIGRSTLKEQKNVSFVTVTLWGGKYGVINVEVSVIQQNLGYKIIDVSADNALSMTRTLNMIIIDLINGRINEDTAKSCTMAGGST